MLLPTGESVDIDARLALRHASFEVEHQNVGPRNETIIQVRVEPNFTARGEVLVFAGEEEGAESTAVVLKTGAMTDSVMP